MDRILQERASGHPQMSVGRVVADGGVGGVLTIGVDLYTFGSARALPIMSWALPMVSWALPKSDPSETLGNAYKLPKSYG